MTVLFDIPALNLKILAPRLQDPPIWARHDLCDPRELVLVVSREPLELRARRLLKAWNP